MIKSAFGVEHEPIEKFFGGPKEAMKAVNTAVRGGGKSMKNSYKTGRKMQGLKAVAGDIGAAPQNRVGAATGLARTKQMVGQKNVAQRAATHVGQHRNKYIAGGAVGGSVATGSAMGSRDKNRSQY